MARARIDRLKVKELFDNGIKVIDIAEQLGCTKGAVSKIVKEMGHETAKAAVVAAPKYEKRRDRASQHLLFLADKAKSEITWIERTVPPANSEEYQKWQDQKLKFAAELRKLISAMADIGYKLFQQEQINEILYEIDEEIGRESKECQARIRTRLQRRRNLRFPVIIDK